MVGIEAAASSEPGERRQHRAGDGLDEPRRGGRVGEADRVRELSTQRYRLQWVRLSLAVGLAVLREEKHVTDHLLEPVGRLRFDDHVRLAVSAGSGPACVNMDDRCRGDINRDIRAGHSSR
ncbi:MAG: hypothetical protein ABIM89_19175 [Mycobacteriales bacterium]